jgi:hypothetical protein
MPEISKQLQECFHAESDDPNHVEAVIVTLAPDADVAQLKHTGMHIERTMRNLPIVTGKIDAAALHALSLLDGVVRVELDSTMRALGD